MPVRIYEIAKRLNLDVREVLAEAKRLGIAAAKVPSSSLDKITGEFLEEKLSSSRPDSQSSSINSPSAPAATPIPPPVKQPLASAPVMNAQPSVSFAPSDRFTKSHVHRQILSKLEQGRNTPYGAPNARGFTGKAFESNVNRLLDELFPFAVLPGIRLFSSEPRGRIDYGFEIDNLVHIRHQEIDYLVEIEIKHQPVTVERNRWTVKYDGETSCAREQVDNHIRTMWEYLRPIARQTELKFVSVVVSSDLQTTPARADGYRNAELHLCSIKDLPALLSKRFNFEHAPNLPKPEALRVSQSGFLDLLRLSLPVEHLGHPELSSAIRYVERCRRTLDETLFQKFAPTPERWVINGSAGMGKSVLLAYTAAVLSSGYELYRALGAVGVKRASDTFKKILFSPDPKRGSIAVMAMSTKQLENIRAWFALFVEQFQQADVAGDVRFRPPEFVLCRPGAPLAGIGDRCSALLVDEAHDIPLFAAREVAELHMKQGLYVVVACDRHQKLRLAGSDARIIEGLDFTNRSTRLRQIYRNPAPVYIASLGIMFRWFADSGPKVVPTVKQLEEEFGFEVTSSAAGLEMLMRSDAHPANSWCHTVASFPDAAAAYSALVKEKLGHADVLWVRFCEEDPDFDYEKLNKHFTYHNCRDREAHKISDKYIKGQDYPIVVIEGFPGFMDRFDATEHETSEAAEARAWAFRRELYLCASRATTFLYFVCNVPETPEVLRIQAELHRLINATAIPERFESGGTKSWRFLITKTDQSRKVEVFADAVSAAILDDKPIAVAPVKEAVTPRQQTQIAQSPPPKPEPLAQPKAPLANGSNSTPEKPIIANVARPVDTTPTSSIPVHAVEPASAAPVPTPPSSLPKTEPSPAPAKQTLSSTNLSALGATATLAEVAAYLKKDVAELSARAARVGVKVSEPSTRVNVSFILGLFKQPSLPAPQAASATPQQLPGAPSPKGAPVQPMTPQPAKQVSVLVQEKPTMPTETAAVGAANRRPVLHVRRPITVSKLAALLGVKTFVVSSELIALKQILSAHHPVDDATVLHICSRRGFQVEFISS